MTARTEFPRYRDLTAECVDMAERLAADGHVRGALEKLDEAESHLNIATSNARQAIAAMRTRLVQLAGGLP